MLTCSESKVLFLKKLYVSQNWISNYEWMEYMFSSVRMLSYYLSTDDSKVFTDLHFSMQREDFRKEFQEKNPDIKSMRDVGSLFILLSYIDIL